MTARTITKESARALSSENDSIDAESSPSPVDGDEQIYYVKGILAEQIETDGSMWYLIDWEGYDILDSTWEPLENIECQETLSAWEQKKSRIKRGLEEAYDVEALNAKKLSRERKIARSCDRGKVNHDVRGVSVSTREETGKDDLGSIRTDSQTEDCGDGIEKILPQQAARISKRKTSKERANKQAGRTGSQRERRGSNSNSDGTSDDSLMGSLFRKAEQHPTQASRRLRQRSQRWAPLVSTENNEDNVKQHKEVCILFQFKYFSLITCLDVGLFNIFVETCFANQSK
jgi:hypothetical protein